MSWLRLKSSENQKGERLSPAWGACVLNDLRGGGGGEFIGNRNRQILYVRSRWRAVIGKKNWYWVKPPAKCQCREGKKTQPPVGKRKGTRQPVRGETKAGNVAKSKKDRYSSRMSSSAVSTAKRVLRGRTRQTLLCKVLAQRGRKVWEYELCRGHVES